MRMTHGLKISLKAFFQSKVALTKERILSVTILGASRGFNHILVLSMEMLVNTEQLRRITLIDLGLSVTIQTSIGSKQSHSCAGDRPLPLSKLELKLGVWLVPMSTPHDTKPI